MTILLTGHRGQLGHELSRRLADNSDLIIGDRSRQNEADAGVEWLDLAQPDSVAAVLDRVNPALILNAAAYTAVDQAESEPELAQAVNAESVGVMARWCADNHARLVHYSTDYVFDGQASEPYSEDHPVAPVSVYGRSKLAGERAIAESGCTALVFRTAWVYANRGRNFLNTMIRLSESNTQLRVVDDQLGTPTHAASLASLSLTASRRWLSQDDNGQAEIYHLSSRGDAISWYQFACTLFSELKQRELISQVPEIIAIPGSEYPTPAARPAWSVLDNSRFERTFDIVVPHWQAQLRQCCDARLSIG